ncbi:DNA/RNA non-specific endonuclease, partial [Saprospiraceae bacterium]|nr:DNA/RNA non-specific endonuclease [Saprospiraceae bacterium]
MAKFRQNHSRGSKTRSLGFIKIILFVAILGVVLFYLSKLMDGINIDYDADSETDDGIEQVGVFDFTKDDSDGTTKNLPQGSSGEIVKHKHYSLSYMEDFEQAEWVAYELTKESIRRPNVPRAKRFNKDPLVSTGSAEYYDYRGSGY